MGVTLALCFAFALSFLTGDQEEIDNYYNQYVRSTQDFHKTTVTMVKKEIDNAKAEDEGSGNGSNKSEGSQINPEDWLAICKKVHNNWGGAGFTYNNGGTQHWTDFKGNDVIVRTDCSGYVSACLYSAGLTTNPRVHTSQENWNENVTGVVEITDKTDLQVGDIKVTDSHVEIYAGNDAGNNKVYNWGSPSSAQNLYLGKNADEVDPRTNCSSDKMGDKIKKIFRVTVKSSTPDSIQIKNKMILVDGGHGYKSPNTSTQKRDTGEESWTYFAAEILGKELQKVGFTVEVTNNKFRWDNSNYKRGEYFYGSNNSLFIQVHYNGSDGSGSEEYRNIYNSMNTRTIGSGKNDIIYANVGNTGQLLCPAHFGTTDETVWRWEESFCEKVGASMKAMGDEVPIKFNKVFGKGLSIDNGCPTKPIILWEAGYGDEKKDREILYDKAQYTKLARCFAEALAECWPD